MGICQGDGGAVRLAVEVLLPPPPRPAHGMAHVSAQHINAADAPARLRAARPAVCAGGGWPSHSLLPTLAASATHWSNAGLPGPQMRGKRRASPSGAGEGGSLAALSGIGPPAGSRPRPRRRSAGVGRRGHRACMRGCSSSSSAEGRSSSLRRHSSMKCFTCRPRPPLALAPPSTPVRVPVRQPWPLRSPVPSHPRFPPHSRINSLSFWKRARPRAANAQGASNAHGDAPRRFPFAPRSAAAPPAAPRRQAPLRANPTIKNRTDPRTWRGGEEGGGWGGETCLHNLLVDLSGVAAFAVWVFVCKDLEQAHAEGVDINLSRASASAPLLTNLGICKVLFYIRRRVRIRRRDLFRILFIEQLRRHKLGSACGKHNHR